MRFSIPIALIFVIFLVGTIWYQSTASICPAPLSYRVGEVNPSFSLSFEEAKEKVKAAELGWEEAVNRDLFVYDDGAKFTVNFIFDERQAQSDAEEKERRFLDGQLAENQELFLVVETAQKEYDKLAANYEQQADAYAMRLAEYNKTVQKYNDRGGAPKEIFDNLEQERIELNREAEELTETVKQLNDLGNRINELSAEGNRLINAYNDEVEDYNQTFGIEREFTQGDYRGEEINIYEFSSDNELQGVLLHEFGHALGIGHVEASSSVMYYLLEENDVEPMFSSYDLEAFYSACGTGNEWGNQSRKIIRKILAIF